jgi:predicted permease
MLQTLYSRLRALWNWRRNESDLDDELQFHLSEETDERAADGLSADEARLAARRDFGNVTLIREVTREAWGWGGSERLLQDVRYGLRAMRRQPAFSAVAVMTLALGIGSTTAILNVVNALLLRPLPFPEADRLVAVYATTPKLGVSRDTTSFLNFSDWSAQSRTFAAAAAFRPDPFFVTGDGTPEPIAGIRASHELFNVLGVRPVLGRAFDQEEQHAKTAVALISHGLWTRRYGGDPGILGKTILLNEVNHAVIGVLPPGFEFPVFQSTDVVVPVLERPCRGCGYLRGVARLKPAVPASAAQREMDSIALGLEQAYPDANGGRGISVVPLQDVAVGQVRTPLFVMLGAGFIVLLIGCGNVGHLMLARGLARRRELAVRSALGAGAGRLVRQLLTESVTLALIAALLGAVLALLGSRFLVSSLSQRFPLPPIAFDWPLLLFAALIAAVSGVLSGAPLAIMVWRSHLNDALKQDGRSQSGGATERRLGRLLIVGETALTVMLLIGAGLLVKSFVRLQQIDLGTDPRRALTADLLLPKRYADPGNRGMFIRQIIDSVGALPGVQAVAIHVDPPFLGGGRRETFNVEGHDDPSPGNGHPAAFNILSGRFFDAMDIPVIRGRDFNDDDTAASAPVAIVNETMARAFWPKEDAIGKRLRFNYDKNRERWYSIVGVVRDVKYRGRLMEPAPQVFVSGLQPFYKADDPFASIVVRTAGDPAGIAAAVRSRIWDVDRDQPILRLQPLERVLWASAAEPRVYMLLLGLFAAIALVIACAGIYGLSAYAVVRRTREIGVRLAIGATPRQILSLLLGQGMALILVGSGIGVAGALALTRVMSGLLHGITATDGPTFLAVLILFAGVALLSTLLPARRATRIDPTIAFRYE